MEKDYFYNKDLVKASSDAIIKSSWKDAQKAIDFFEEGYDVHGVIYSKQEHHKNQSIMKMHLQKN